MQRYPRDMAGHGPDTPDARWANAAPAQFAEACAQAERIAERRLAGKMRA